MSLRPGDEDYEDERRQMVNEDREGAWKCDECGFDTNSETEIMYHVCEPTEEEQE